MCRVLQSAWISGFKSDTDLGAWLEKRPLTHHAADSIFLHGGINPRVMDHLLPDLEAFNYLNSLFLSNSGEATLPAFMKTSYGRVVYDLVTYRGNHKNCREVKAVAQDLNLSRVILGHTPDDSVRVTCGGTLLAIDSALGRWIRTMGNFFCVGDEDEVSANGKFVCQKVDGFCDGEVTKLVRSKSGENLWNVHVVDSKGGETRKV